jgi:ABC-type branched-subunit amino acid transport system substrate-binding protein
MGHRSGADGSTAARPARRRRIGIGVAVLIAIALVAGACSSGRGSDAGGDGSTATTKAAAAESAFGDLASPCGPGDATGATAQGVTADAITIGYGDDAGYQPAPGLSHELSDAVKAMISWCNDQGGINGRKVVGNYYDAKVTEVTNAMTQACEQVFMLVGQGWVFDSGQETIRQGCGLPAVPGYAVSPQFSNAPDQVQAVPNPVDYMPTQFASAFQKLFPEEIKKTGLVYADYPATKDPKDKVVATYPAFGFEFLPCDQIYGIQGESDWKPLAQKLKDCGAETVYFAGSPYPNFENFLDAANQIDYHPIWFSDANMYDETFAQWNVNGYADKVYMRSSFTPLFEADKVPATQQYIDIVTASGGETNQLGQQAASAFLLWATAAKQCGSNVTRECVMGELGKITSWTGGGMHSVGNPAENMPATCGMVMKLSGTSFERVYPEEPGTLDCSPDFVQPVTGPLLERANLDANRQSQLQ